MKYKLVALALLLSCFFSSCLFESCPTSRKRLHLNKTFSCKIDTLYRDINQKKQPFVVVNRIEYIIINSIFDDFSIGDTLVKNSGSMKHYWIKNGDTTVFYQQCGKVNVKD